MKRAWQVWLGFAVCVVVAAVAMIWLTRQAMESDRQRQIAQANVELEQKVSLALWLMDTELAPVIAEEVIRPADDYMIAPPLPNADNYVLARFEIGNQSRSWGTKPGSTELGQLADKITFAALLEKVPSAQLPTSAEMGDNSVAQSGVNKQPYFEGNRLPEADEDLFGEGESGETATGRDNSNDDLFGPASVSQASQPATADMTDPLFGESNTGVIQNADDDLFGSPAASGTSPASDVGSNANASVPVDDLFGTPAVPQTSQAPANASTPASDVASSGNPNSPTDDLFGPIAIVPAPPGEKPQAAGGKITKSAKVSEFEQRNLRLQNYAQQSLSNQQRQMAANAPGQSPESQPDQSVATPVKIGVSRPFWLDGQLLLARRVGSSGNVRVQGCVLDWPRIKGRLLENSRDALSGAELVPATDATAADPGRMLAGLPVQLVVNSAPVAASISPSLRWSLWLGWGAAALAAVAAATLLSGVMALSERRAAFVSSVSHELRTPLTTFRMYSEMLARGMVPDAERRQEYLDTLQREAERLTLLVENVLAYARLERGRRPQAEDRVTVKTLADRIGPRLAHRAAQADMECEMWIDGITAQAELTTDLNVVEQILFNLVDNAAKYARSATNRTIEVVATRNGRWVNISIGDHGPGFEKNGSGFRMRPFAKSAEQSAETAPGVGLGLALCQRLARQLGGRLEQSETPGGGATVTLSLPVE